jgi:hypothetical protein
VGRWAQYRKRGRDTPVFTEPPGPGLVTDFNLDNVTTSEIDFSQNADTEFCLSFEISLHGADTWTDFQSTSQTEVASFTGLDEGTPYDIRVAFVECSNRSNRLSAYTYLLITTLNA